MSQVVELELQELFEEAESRESCLVLGESGAERLRRALCRRVAAGSVVSPARGLFATAERWDGLKKDGRAIRIARGLQELHSDWVFCGPTAALAYGVDVSYPLLDRVHVATTLNGHGKDGPIVTRHAILGSAGDPSEIEVVNGLRVTSPGQTVFDCLRWADFAHGLGIADSALRTGTVARDELEQLIASSNPCLRGRSRAMRTLSHADPRAENGGESIARARMLSLGYVCPELQVEVPRVAEEGRPYRADFCWVRSDGLVILGELDGGGKYVEEELMGGRSLGEVLSDENVRGSRFTLYDVSLVRFPFDVTERPAEFRALLDEYGVPMRGSDLALPEGTPQIPDWEALRRSRPEPSGTAGST